MATGSKGTLTNFDENGNRFKEIKIWLPPMPKPAEHTTVSCFGGADQKIAITRRVST